MTLQDLANIINEQLRIMPRCANTIVCIHNNIPQMGPMATINVKSVYLGVDYNRNKFIIEPEKKMIEKP
jgi:hypothetical protein